MTPMAPGKPVGLIKLPIELWGTGKFTGTLTSLTPQNTATVMRKAAATGMALLGTVPRAQVTNTGETKGYFVLSKGKAAIDGIARQLATVPATRPHLRGLQAIDEPHLAGSEPSAWDRAAKQAEVAEYLRYAQAKLPGLLIYIRVQPSNPWIQDYESWPRGLGAFAQWSIRRGPRRVTDLVERQRAYYRMEHDVADELGWTLIAGVSVRDFGGANTNVQATAAQIRAHVGEATRTPWNCFSAHWWYEPNMLRDRQLAAAWAEEVERGRRTPAVGCGASV